MEKDQLTKPKKVVVIGGSAGALSVVLQIVSRLRAGTSLAVLIVLHRKASDDNVLVDVLTSRTSFKVVEVDDKDTLEAGVIYVAPADYHVLIERDGSLTLDYSEKVNYSRPSIDVSFESAAEVYGRSLICVLLSGANADGVAGLVHTRRLKGTVVIQDPASAEFMYMPKVAIDQVKPDLLLDDKNIDSLLKLFEN